ncbi:MAG: DUF4968 domain-containing protein, partial [Saprospiraceae bacterium]|nr:DUF4968 domain-containing protein [Pyrinomonadaceae bacterium]
MSIKFKAFIFTSFLCLYSFAAIPCEAAWQSVGNVNRITRTKANGVILDTSSRAKISVEFFDLDVIRIRISPTGKIERDFSYAVDYSIERNITAAKITETRAEIVLVNGSGAKIVIRKMPYSVRVFDKIGEVVLRDDPARPTLFDSVTGDIQTTKLRKSEVETYYGFGEKAFMEMSRNGKYIVNWN